MEYIIGCFTIIVMMVCSCIWSIQIRSKFYCSIFIGCF